MASRILLVVLTLLALPLYILLHRAAWEERAEVRRSAEASYVIPSKFSRILALEHQGLLADFLLLKTITFFGERSTLDQPLSNDDWNYIVANLDTVTDLDPYFLDPYVLAEGLLTWEAGRYDDANRLLEKGLKYRTWDWGIPFYMGFNYFFFLKDTTKGADYLIEASKLPDSPTFLPGLAARINYYGGKTKTAILFLKGVIAGTSDERIRQWLERRLLALERADLVEQALERFVHDRGGPPEQLSELVTAGYLPALPEDPYGGEWVLMDNGRIFSTSKFVPPPPNKDGDREK